MFCRQCGYTLVGMAFYSQYYFVGLSIFRLRPVGLLTIGCACEYAYNLALGHELFLNLTGLTHYVCVLSSCEEEIQYNVKSFYVTVYSTHLSQETCTL